MRVINKCRVDFQYRLSSKSPLVIKTNYSNTASTDIIKDILKIEKYVDKETTYDFDILTYMIVISNISDYIVSNIFFKDDISKAARFIENTVRINNRKKRCINPNKGFFICDNLEPMGIMIIQFKVLVLPFCFCECIRNYSTVEHDYIYNIEKPPARVEYSSNEVCTQKKDKLFKEILVEDTVELVEHIEDKINVDVCSEIIKTKVVNTPINQVYRTYKSNICKLIVFGCIEYEIMYMVRNKQKHKKEVSGFSSYMLVPIGIVYNMEIDIKTKINSIAVYKYKNNEILISTNILLYI